MISAARQFPITSLRAFVIADHATFAGEWAADELANIDEINQTEHQVLCRDRHLIVAGELYDAVIKTTSGKYYVARITQHHGLTENQKLAQRELPPMIWLALKFIGCVIFVLGVGIGLYLSIGWLGVIFAVVVTITALSIVSVIANKRRYKAHMASVNAHNRQEIDRISRR